MEFKNILLEEKEGIAYVTLNRPKALNALNTEVLSELDSAFRYIDKTEDIRTVIVTGSGRAFIAGADIAQMSALDGTEGRDMTVQRQKVMEPIEKIKKPVLEAVKRVVTGGRG